MNTETETTGTPPNVGAVTAPFEPFVASEVAVSIEDLETHKTAWEKLIPEALEPNVFYEPWFALAALRHLPSDSEVQFLFVYYCETPGVGGRRLIGLFPLIETSVRTWLPMRALRLWHHPYCFLHTPIVHRQFAAIAIAELVRFAKTRASFLILDEISGDRAFFAALVDALNDDSGNWNFLEMHTRACWTEQTDRTHPSFLAGRHLKELRRLRSRLADQGELTFKCSREWADTDLAISEFLNLEASGWKGREGTALQANVGDAEFFREICVEAANRGQLEICALRTNNEPRALKCCFLHGTSTSAPGGYSFKTAFNEAYARFSPGVLMELDHRQHLSNPSDIQWIDSCAKAEHFMINRIWNGRKTIVTACIATGGFFSKLCLSMLPVLRYLRSLISVRST